MENQAQMPATSTQYGGFWLRVLAYLIDGAILAFCLGIIAGIFIAPAALRSLETARDTGSTPNLILIILPQLLYIIVPWIYFAWMESSKIQATVGKLSLNLKVTDAGGNKISFGRATGRYFA